MPRPSPRRSAERVTEKPTQPRLLADENTSHRFVSACRRLVHGFPVVHIARWQDGSWLGLDDAALLIACAESSLILVAFDRATLPWHAGQVIRAGGNGVTVIHLMYFDGLSTISLFEEQVAAGARGGGPNWMPGEVGASGLRWVAPGGAVAFTLIGDVLPQELEKVKGSLQGGR